MTRDMVESCESALFVGQTAVEGRRRRGFWPAASSLPGSMSSGWRAISTLVLAA